MQFSHLSRCLVFAAAAILAGSCAAQVMQDPGTLPDGRRVQFPGESPARHHAPARLARHPESSPMPPGQAQPPQVKIGSTAQASPTVPAAAVRRPALPSLLDKPPQPATVTLSSGQLAVRADNSSLSQILDQLASSSGMTINGLNKDQRVFGSYGPGTPQQVLSSLLDGAGYNVMMVGATPDGAPRQLILTARSNAPVTPAQQAPPQDDQPLPDDDDNQNNDNPPVNFPERINPVMPRMPPEGQSGGGVKTPQQILQELQQLRQQQQQAPQ